MQQYLTLLADILENGTQQPNRTGIDLIKPSDFGLEDYQHHAPIKAPMAV